MKKFLQTLARIGIAIVFLIYAICLAMVSYVLYAQQGMPIWQIIIILGIFILIPAIIIYAFISANRNNSPQDSQREQEVLDDVRDIRKGKYLSTKTTLGKWYLAALIFIFIFPVFAYIIGKFDLPSDQEINIILGLGYFFIIIFIGVMIWKGRRK